MSSDESIRAPTNIELVGIVFGVLLLGLFAADRLLPHKAEVAQPLPAGAQVVEAKAPAARNPRHGSRPSKAIEGHWVAKSSQREGEPRKPYPMRDGQDSAVHWYINTSPKTIEQFFANGAVDTYKWEIDQENTKENTLWIYMWDTDKEHLPMKQRNRRFFDLSGNGNEIRHSIDFVASRAFAAQNIGSNETPKIDYDFLEYVDNKTSN